MKGQIFILDDNPVDLKIISHIAQQSGYDPVGFVDHKEGMKWLEENVPQIILLDLQLTSITGYQLIPGIKKEARFADTQLIIISGKNQDTDIIKALKLGAHDYIIKPVDAMVLQEKLRKVSDSRSDFSTISIPTGTMTEVGFLKQIQIMAISEFGVKIQSDQGIEVNDTITLGNLSEDAFGSRTLLLRCLTKTHQADKKNYIMQFTYVATTEAQRQAIRKYCRALYILQKKNDI